MYLPALRHKATQAGLPKILRMTEQINSALTVISYILRLWKIPLLLKTQKTDKYLLGIIVIFAVMVIPFTPLTSIDTYKWLNLAKTMRAEHMIFSN